MSRWRFPALSALWLQVAALLGTAAYALWHSQFGPGGWLSGGEAFLAALVLAWWTQLFARLTASPPPADLSAAGSWRALALAYPWLTALRFSLWSISLLLVLGGAAPTANPVALSALFTLWGAALWASNASNAGLLRLAAAPHDPQARRRLRDWLNLAAALSLAMAVMNVVPVAGYSETPDLASQLVYGLGGLLDVLATLLAFLTLGEAPLPTPPGREA